MRRWNVEPSAEDWSINLPSWAYNKGYSLRGKCGTYDELELWKDSDLVKRFPWNKVPNIFEMEGIIDAIERDM